MPNAGHTGNRQGELFPHSKRPAMEIDPEHPLVRMADMIDWDELDPTPETARLLDDVVLWRERRRRGLEVAATFSIDQVLDRLETILGS